MRLADTDGFPSVGEIKSMGMNREMGQPAGAELRGLTVSGAGRGGSVEPNCYVSPNYYVSREG
jgi:hypothetical protein